MAPPALWTYAAPPAPRAPHVMLIAFGAGPLTAGVPLSLSQFGLPSAAHARGIEVRSIAAPADDGWIDGWRRGALRSIATSDLGDQLAALDAADHAHVVQAQPAAPADLGYLQAAWGMARYLGACGAGVVLDVHAARFLPAAALPAVDAALDTHHELRLVYETDSTRPDGAHALHTRGMRKFGAPEIVALCTDDDTGLVGEVVSQLADTVARGGDLASPRHGVDLDPGTTWYAVEDAHGLADLLQLNNDARILVDGAGRHLIGVAARLRPS